MSSGSVLIYASASRLRLKQKAALVCGEIFGVFCQDIFARINGPIEPCYNGARIKNPGGKSVIP